MIKGKTRERMPSKCDRCGKEGNSYTMSIFNTDWICDDCQDVECRHRDYPKARKAELEACKRGDYNYPGIGLPLDLGG